VTAGSDVRFMLHHPREPPLSTPRSCRWPSPLEANLPFALQSHFGQGVMPKPIHCNMGLRKTAE